MIIFERNFWKCLLRESLESVEKFLSSISFLLSISIPMTIPSITFDKGFDSFLITANLQNKNNPSGCLKKLNKWSHLTVNDLIEFLNYRICSAHEKEAIAPKFSAENLFGKKFTYDSEAWKEWNTKKQH